MANEIQQILDRLGMARLNQMQLDTYREVTGTDADVVGKTLAYMLPLAGMIDVSSDAVQAVVIVPNRELALQSAEVMCRFGLHIRTVCCYGGRPAMDEHRVIRQVAPHVVFGTPGRLNDHFDKGNLSPYTARFLVIDEFDKCLEMGFHNEMAKLLKRLSGVRRRFLLSATDADRIPDFVNARHVAKVDYSEGGISSRVEQYCLKSADKDKLEALGNLLCTIGRQSSMVFLNYRDSVERVASYLRGRGFGVSAFHGGLEQPEREAALYRFGNGSANVLVSTDLASRGLDIPDVDNIIHYHMPLTRESYIHRVGRTARWDATGKSFFILSPDESLPDFVEKECSPITLPEQMPGVPQPKMETSSGSFARKADWTAAPSVGLTSGSATAMWPSAVKRWAKCSQWPVEKRLKASRL